MHGFVRASIIFEGRRVVWVVLPRVHLISSKQNVARYSSNFYNFRFIEIVKTLLNKLFHSHTEKHYISLHVFSFLFDKHYGDFEWL